MKSLMMFLCGIFIMVMPLLAQDKYFTNNGFINFFSSAPLEDISADNNQVAVFLDIKTGEVVFAVLMKGFQFEKALMQEHFNENYVESHKFPKANFKGQIVNWDEVDVKKPGVYDVRVKGDLTIHGVTRQIQADGTLEVKPANIIAKTVFYVSPEDYDIVIPAAVRENIAKSIRVTVDTPLAPYKN